MKIKKHIFLISVNLSLLLTAPSFAESIEVKVLNEKNREVKTYSFGNEFFEIDIRFVKGWSKCIAPPLKKFDYEGSPTIRGELYCQTTRGETQSLSCVAKSKNVDVAIVNIFGGNFKFTGENNILADSYAEITISCVNL